RQAPRQVGNAHALVRRERGQDEARLVQAAPNPHAGGDERPRPPGPAARPEGPPRLRGRGLPPRRPPPREGERREPLAPQKRRRWLRTRPRRREAEPESPPIGRA